MLLQGHAVSGIGGALYVAGRLAAGLETWRMQGDTCSFTVLPDTVDPMWQYGKVSHLSLFYFGKHWVYTVQSGFIADRRVVFQWPSWGRFPYAPGARLPML
jgi:hypothetical protein